MAAEKWEIRKGSRGSECRTLRSSGQALRRWLTEQGGISHTRAIPMRISAELTGLKTGHYKGVDKSGTFEDQGRQEDCATKGLKEDAESGRRGDVANVGDELTTGCGCNGVRWGNRLRVVVGCNVKKRNGARKSWAAGILAMGVMALCAVRSEAQKAAENPVGIFEGHGDVGNVGEAYKGSVEFDEGKGTYTVTGGGENMWSGSDAFQFAWKRVNGDVTLTADIALVGTGKNPHRKAVLMVRESLDADSVYADVAVHGVGLTSLQYRDEKGGTKHEVQANVTAPKRVRIEKRGNYFTMWVAGEDGKFQLAGATGKIALKGTYYVGIGVCSHEKDLVEKAVFSNIELERKSGREAEVSVKLYSMMEIIDTESTDRRAVFWGGGG